jgi:hypothetical protein
MTDIFDVLHWKNNESAHMKIVKEEENKDMMGGQGNYMLKDGYALCILAS